MKVIVSDPSGDLIFEVEALFDIDTNNIEFYYKGKNQYVEIERGDAYKFVSGEQIRGLYHRDPSLKFTPTVDIVRSDI